MHHRKDPNHLPFQNSFTAWVSPLLHLLKSFMGLWDMVVPAAMGMDMVMATNKKAGLRFTKAGLI